MKKKISHFVFSTLLMILITNVECYPQKYCFGGSNTDLANSIIQTADSGFIAVGYSKSEDGDLSGNEGNSDLWIVRLDTALEGVWGYHLGGSGFDEAQSVQQTSDGGFIIAGYTNSNDGVVVGNHGGYDVWMIKLDSDGFLQWANCYGGSNEDKAYSVRETSNGGFIVAGSTKSDNGDVSDLRGKSDFWVLRLDASGNIIWAKCFGGSETDIAKVALQTSDGGFIVAGSTESDDNDVTDLKGDSDYWLVRLTSDGLLEWQKTYGGSSRDVAHDMIITSYGGFAMTGQTESSDGDVSGYKGDGDYWVVQTNSIGELQWKKTFGGSSADESMSILQTFDGNFIAAGFTASNDGDIVKNNGEDDFWIVKLEAQGDIIWQKNFGGSRSDIAESVIQTIDSGYVVAGATASSDGDVFGNHGDSDLWVLKIPPEGSGIPKVFLEVDKDSISENGGKAVITAKLDIETDDNVTVNLSFGGSAVRINDYVPSQLSILIPPGSLEGTATITAKDDNEDEEDETAIIGIESVINAEEDGTQQITITIIDDDTPVPKVSLSVDKDSVEETGGMATVTALLDVATSVDVTVDLAVSGSATDNVDYILSSKEIVINAGDTEGSAIITSVNDSYEEDDENVLVYIDSVINGEEDGDQQVEITILDDDGYKPKVSLEIDKDSIPENGGTATVTAILDSTSKRDVTVKLSQGGSADSSDYSLSSSEILIPSGNIQGETTINTIDDDAAEETEYIWIRIESVVNGIENGDQLVTVFIIDNDGTDVPEINDGNISLYPVPASDHLILDMNSFAPLIYKIFDLYGNKMKSGRTRSNRTELDLSGLSAGLYIININNKFYKTFLIE